MQYSPRNTLVISAVLIGALLSILAQAQPSAPKPVPANKINGTQLVLADLNISIDSPWQNPQWLEVSSGDPSAKVYLCKNPVSGKSIMMMLSEKEKLSYSESDLKQYLEGIRKSAAEQGWQVESNEYKATNIPRPGSYFYTYTTNAPVQGRLVWHGYLISNPYLCTIQEATTSSEPSKEFQAFANSLKMGNPTSIANVSAETKHERLMKASSTVSIFVMILYAVILFIFPSMGRKRVDGLTVAIAPKRAISVAALVLLLIVHLSFQLLMIFNVPSISPEEAGRLVGHAAGAFALPMFIYILLNRSKSKTHDLTRKS